MNEEKLQGILKEADRLAGKPEETVVSVSLLRRRVRRRRAIATGVPSTVAAAVIMGVLLLCEPAEQPEDSNKAEIAALQAQVEELRDRTDAALALVHEVIASQRQERRMEVVTAQYATARDPLEQVRREVDRTASILFYRADRLCRQAGDMEGALDGYEQVIRLFPESGWAEKARRCIVEIKEGKKPDSTNMEGDKKWKPRDTSLSC
jgi:hypothetical protein